MTLLLMTSSFLIVLAHYQVIFANVTLLSHNSKVEMLVLQAQRRFTAHKAFSVTEMRLPRQEMAVICTIFLYFVFSFLARPKVIGCKPL